MGLGVKTWVRWGAGENRVCVPWVVPGGERTGLAWSGSEERFILAAVSGADGCERGEDAKRRDWELGVASEAAPGPPNSGGIGQFGGKAVSGARPGAPR